jgi:hypothetical protein
MKLKNAFSEDTRWLFAYNYYCFYCNTNGWDALHHIVGRKSNSPLNAAPIHNHSCHIGNFKLDSFEMRSLLLKKTKIYLDENNYEYTEKDLKFLEANSKYYE